MEDNVWFNLVLLEIERIKKKIESLEKELEELKIRVEKCG